MTTWLIFNIYCIEMSKKIKEQKKKEPQLYAISYKSDLQKSWLLYPQARLHILCPWHFMYKVWTHEHTCVWHTGIYSHINLFIPRISHITSTFWSYQCFMFLFHVFVISCFICIIFHFFIHNMKGESHIHWCIYCFILLLIQH